MCCRGGLVFKTHRLLDHSTLGLRVIKKKKSCRTDRGEKEITRIVGGHAWVTRKKHGPYREADPQRLGCKMKKHVQIKGLTCYLLVRDNKTLGPQFMVRFRERERVYVKHKMFF